jgi:sulfopyruvate decarboxylase TPP-binding subunit
LDHFPPDKVSTLKNSLCDAFSIPLSLIIIISLPYSIKHAIEANTPMTQPIPDVITTPALFLLVVAAGAPELVALGEVPPVLVATEPTW